MAARFTVRCVGPCGASLLVAPPEEGPSAASTILFATAVAAMRNTSPSWSSIRFLRARFGKTTDSSGSRVSGLHGLADCSTAWMAWRSYVLPSLATTGSACAWYWRGEWCVASTAVGAVLECVSQYCVHRRQGIIRGTTGWGERRGMHLAACRR